MYEIISVYRSPATNVKAFIDQVDTFLGTLSAKHRFLVGDTNINILETTDRVYSIDQLKYRDVMAANGYISCINIPTRSTATTNTCIDHIYLHSSKDCEILPVVLQTSVTDHFATSFSWNSKASTFDQQKDKNNTPIYRKIDYEMLEEELSKTEWKNVLECENPDLALEKFMCTLRRALDNSTSAIQSQNKSRFRKIKPWITKGLIVSIRKRDAMSRAIKKDCEYRKLNNLNLNTEFVKKYKMYRNFLSALIRQTKNNYYKSKINLCKNDPKLLWKVINDVTGCSKNSDGVNDIKEVLVGENNISSTDSPKEVANAFVDHFTDVGSKLASKIKNKTSGHPSNNKVDASITFQQITQEEMLGYISQLKDTSACGFDDIQVLTIKKIKLFIIEPIVHIFNLCLNTGIFPNSLKTAIIKPIFKAKDKHLIENYRPISILTHFSKLLEKCIKFRLVQFFDKHNIISNSQFGFRSNLSTQDAIYALTTEIGKNLDKTRKTLAVFLDLAKAFDTVQHDLLLKKLENCGIRDTPLILIKNYLSARTQYVKINNTLSNPRTLECGVPQGTVLGPILFLVYINDLCNLQICGKLISYADDTALIFSGQSFEDAKRNAEKGLKIVYEWLNNNLLTLNLDKTVFVSFSFYDNIASDNVTLKIHEPLCTLSNNSCYCYNLTKCYVTKYLGVLIDHHLNWKNHINSVTSKLRAISYKFYRLRPILNLENLKLVYYAFAQSYLLYAILSWGGALKTHMKPLKIAQKSILKTVFNKPRYYPTCKLFDEAKVCNLTNLFIKTLMLFMYKNNLSKNQILNRIHLTRSSLIVQLNVPTMHTSFGQRQSVYLGPKLFNNLPLEITSSENVKVFKHNLCKWLHRSTQNYLDDNFGYRPTPVTSLHSRL
jgi:Reverse transcriptase (RNA-dependent DNA polymerase)